VKHLILASRSPRRRRLLKESGIPFTVRVSSADENTNLKKPSAIVKHLALKKAKVVSDEFPSHPVIGADTIVVCKGHILGKPKNSKDALRLLRLQNGSWQSVYTGLAIVWRDRHISITDYDVSGCKARKLTPQQLSKLAGKHMDKAGAYAVQDDKDPFIEKISGERDNVVGLPCKLLKKMLAKAGFKN